MRAYLDLTAERLVTDLLGAEPVTTLQIGLGHPPLELVFVNGPLPAASVIEFIAKVTIAGAQIVSGSAIVGAAAVGSIDLSEDWKAAALIALFAADEDLVRLKGQYRWHLPTDDAGYYHRTPLFHIDVEATLFAADFVPGASVPAAPFLYLSAVTDYLGAAASLEALPGANQVTGTLFKVIIGGSESEWRLTKPAGEVVTDVNAGVIRLLDGTGYLTRVGGL